MKKIITVLIAAIMITGCTTIVRKPSNMNKMAKGDGFILMEKIEHNVNDKFVQQNSNTGVRILIKTKTNDVENIFVTAKGKKEKMNFYMTEKDFDFYYADINNINEEKIGYYFEIIDGKSVYYKGAKAGNGKNNSGQYTYVMKKNIEFVPEWVYSGTWYKIFVDRFRNGNIDNDPIYNEAGPEMYLQPPGKLASGTLKKNLIDEKNWAEEMSDNYEGFETSKFESSWETLSEWERKVKNDKEWYKNHWRHYGGDIEGVKTKLDYISDMGFKVVSMSPVFYSTSNHKNDSSDIRHIDPSFGVIEESGKIYEGAGEHNSVKGKSEYKLLNRIENGETNYLGESMNVEKEVWTESDIIASEFVSSAHAKGLKVVYDVDISCAGKDFIPFKDVMINGPLSKYKNWFGFNDWEKTATWDDTNIDIWNPLVEYEGKDKYEVIIKDEKKYRRKWVRASSDMSKNLYNEIIKWNIENTDYKAWNGVKGVPLLNTNDAEVQKYIVSGLTKWVKGFKGDLSDGVDGFILLSAEKVDVDLIKKIKKSLVNIKKDFYLGGEVFIEPDKYLKKELLDGVLNYRVVQSAVKFIINNDARYKMKSSEYINENIKTNINIPESFTFGFVNLVDSQDTDRLFSMGINPNRDFDKNNKYEDNYKNIRPDLYSEDAVNNVKIISAIQFLSKGVPAVYYGDEIGMWGGDDPSNRKPMLWEDIKDYAKEQDNLSKYRDFIAKFSKEVGIDEANAAVKYDYKMNEQIKEWYQKIIELRNSETDTIINGKIDYILNDEANDILAYEIFSEKKALVVIINNSIKNRETEPDTEVNLKMRNVKSGSLFDMLSGERYDIVDGKITIKVQKKSVRILKKK